MLGGPGCPTHPGGIGGPSDSNKVIVANSSSSTDSSSSDFNTYIATGPIDNRGGNPFTSAV